MKKGIEGSGSSALRWDERLGIPFACSVGLCESCWTPSRKELRGWSMSRARSRAGEGLEHKEKALENP